MVERNLKLDSLKANLFKPFPRGTIMLICACVIALIAAKSFLSMHETDILYPGPGVTDVKMLSDYFPGLKDSSGDTPIYFLNGAEEGGTTLILGGTHADEPGGYLSAILILENAVVTKGRVIIIPWTNKSGFTNTLPGEASPQRFSIETTGGTRSFAYGSRYINPVHSWPDADVYVHYPSGQRLSGEETRNLNRTFPGRPNGNLAERICYGVTELIRKENVDLVIDLHEAMPEYPNNNVIVSHERAMTVAANAQLDLLLQGISISLSPSPPNFHGLTHREIGDHTDSLVILMEVPTISIGRLRGRTTVETITEAKDDFYVWGAQLGRLFVPFTEEGWALDVRVARHVTGILAVVEAHQQLYPQQAVVLDGVPGYREISTNMGQFLSPPS